MMRTLVIACVLGLVSTTGTPIAAQTSDGRDDGTKAGAFSARLVGTWKSAPDEMKLTSDLDKSVWGPNATSVRLLELTVRPDGQATLRVTKKVVDAKGRLVPASLWIEDTQLKLGGATPGIATRLEHQADVVSAVRRFPDDPEYAWPLDGLKVKLVTFQDGDDNSLEIRYDTPEGRGSFWETLRRERPATRRTARRES